MDAPTPSLQGRQLTPAPSNNKNTIIRQLQNQLAAQKLEAAVNAEENEKLRNQLVAYEATFKAHGELFAALKKTPDTQSVPELIRQRDEAVKQRDNISDRILAAVIVQLNQVGHEIAQDLRSVHQGWQSERKSLWNRVKNLEEKLATTEASYNKDKDAFSALVTELSRSLFGFPPAVSDWLSFARAFKQTTAAKDLGTWKDCSVDCERSSKPTGHEPAKRDFHRCHYQHQVPFSVFGTETAADTTTGNPLGYCRVWHMLNSVNKELSVASSVLASVYTDIVVKLTRHAITSRQDGSHCRPSVVATMISLLQTVTVLRRRFGVTALLRQENQLCNLLYGYSNDVTSLVNLVMGGPYSLEVIENFFVQDRERWLDNKGTVTTRDDHAGYTISRNFRSKEITIRGLEV